jgi:hypothetical protein
VEVVLNRGLRTADIYYEGHEGVKLVSCSEMGDAIEGVLKSKEKKPEAKLEKPLKAKLE